MLRAYVCGTGRLVPAAEKAAAAVWYDLKNPSPEEFAAVALETGLVLPAQADIVEIENSSRLAAAGDVLTMTMPLVTRDADGLHRGDCGFVLAPDRLVTIRFADSLVFDAFPEHPHETGKEDPRHGAFIFTGLLEAIVDRQADALERLRGQLDSFSHNVFHRPAHAREKREEAKLRDMLVTIGIAYDQVSMLRESQLGVGRIAVFVRNTAGWLPAPVETRLRALQGDIDSLNEFSVHLTDKVQFLLDATLGLINVAQSTLMKVFTVVAVIGIPPTLIAGIYGMNFKNMPELSWTYGYQYGWTMIVLSAVLPLVWFRIKGWL